MKVTALTVCAAVALKAWYRDANADQLRWLLEPTAWLAGGGSRTSFTYEPGVGYLDPMLTFQVVSACAGVNFFCIALVSLGALLPSRARSVALAALGAFGLTVLANALRIALALQVHQRHLRLGWLSGARLHEALGVVVYLAMLVGAAQLAHHRTAQGARA